MGTRGTIGAGVVDVAGQELVDEARRFRGSKNEGAGDQVKRGCGSASSLANFLCLEPVKWAKAVPRVLLAHVGESSMVAERVTGMLVGVGGGGGGGGCVEVLALRCEGLVDVLGQFGLGLVEVDG